MPSTKYATSVVQQSTTIQLLDNVYLALIVLHLAFLEMDFWL
jgi:hypothetical protein